MRKLVAKLAIAVVISAPVAAGSGTLAGAQPGGADHGSASSYRVVPVLTGADLSHTFTTPHGTETAPLTSPDDITAIGPDLFVAFQNGLGPQGQPSANTNTASTIVEFTRDGQKIAQWDVIGHCDGLTADPTAHQLIATVNEDANSSLFAIDPVPGGHVLHYRYSENPLPHNGGTDAISVYHGQLLISASAPGTPSPANESPPPAPNPAYPAVYSVQLDPATLVANVRPIFYDESTATAADGPNAGRTDTLGLTDPDSNEVVPWTSPRFRGDFVLDSQGDEQQIYASDPGGPGQQLSVLFLDQSIDDTAWATSPVGSLYASSTASDQVDAVVGRFQPGAAFVAVTPCGADSAPVTCSTPNCLGQLDMATGRVSPVMTTGVKLEPQGMLFLPGWWPTH